MADGINDPKIIIRGANGGGAPTCPSECRKVGLNFTFSVPAHGQGTLFFTNNSGKNWTSLVLVEKGVAAANVTCVQNVFMSCSVTTLKNGSVEILLSGVRGGDNPHTGIPAGSSFAIGFVCAHGSCWPGGLDFRGRANATTATPEPGTVALVVTGLGAIFSRRRKMWRNRLNS